MPIIGRAVGFFVGTSELDVGLGPLLSHEREQCNCVKLALAFFFIKDREHIKINNNNHESRQKIQLYKYIIE